MSFSVIVCGGFAVSFSPVSIAMAVAVSPNARLSSIDTLRGIIMIVMALDHTRDFFHIAAVTGSPTNIDTTTPILFFTRWITHFCAPIFVFLAGLSASLGRYKRGMQGQRRFLLTRGVWLIILELGFFNLIFTFDPAYHFLGLNVLSVTGASMILLALMLQSPAGVIAITGIILVAGHNLLDSFNTATGSLPSLGWSLLHQQSFRVYAHDHLFAVLYPLIPWPGIIMLGYATGSWFSPGYEREKRRRNLVFSGIIVIALFVLLRWLNIYGDLSPREIRPEWIKSFLSFFNTTKYPPSLQFTCMTVGPGLLLLAWLDKEQARWASIPLVYGRVPLFYYLFHFFLLHLAVTAIYFLNGHTLSEAGGMILFRPDNFGYSLAVVYVIWITVVAIVYPFCKWYGRYKAKHPENWWLSYL